MPQEPEPEPKPRTLVQTFARVFKVIINASSFMPFFSIASNVTLDLLSDLKSRQRDFDTQVTDAVQSLRNTSTLISELQKGVEERMTELQQLRQEHDRYSQLAQIEATKAEALLKEIARTLGKERRTERWVALAMHLGVGFLFFALGVVLSDSLKSWATHVWTRIFH
jgi:hypothetical protein